MATMNAAQVMGWMSFAPDLEEMSSGFAGYMEEMRALPSLLNGKIGPRELVRNFASMLGGPSSVFAPGSGISVGDVLSPEAKFAYYINQGGDAANAAWEQASMFTRPDSDWSMMQRLFSDFKLGGNSKIPIETLNHVLSDNAVDTFGPHLRQSFIQDPQAFAEAMAEKRNLLTGSAKEKIAQLMKPTAAEIKEGKEIPDWESHYKEALEKMPAEETLLHYDIYALDSAEEGRQQFVFVCKRGTNTSELHDRFTPEYFGMTENDMHWDGQLLTVPVGSKAAGELQAVAGKAFPAGAPTNRIHEAQEERLHGTNAGLLSFGG